jgi:hypothetical protein
MGHIGFSGLHTEISSLSLCVCVCVRARLLTADVATRWVRKMVKKVDSPATFRLECSFEYIGLLRRREAILQVKFVSQAFIE